MAAKVGDRVDYLSILLGIVAVNLLLSGDNALVIALASRRLPPGQQKKAMLWGSFGAILLRVVLTFVAIALLRIPYLQMVGGILLLWVAVKLVADDYSMSEEVQAASSLGQAIKTILVADLVMSLDNVIAIAGVARGNFLLLVIGLAISMPIIIWGSKLLTTVMHRWPIFIVAGAAFLGLTAGDMVVADQQVLPWVARYSWLGWAVPGSFTAIVILASLLRRARHPLRD